MKKAVMFLVVVEIAVVGFFVSEILSNLSLYHQTEIYFYMQKVLHASIAVVLLVCLIPVTSSLQWGER